MIGWREIDVKGNPEIKKLLWFLFAGSRGSTSRIKIVSYLRQNFPNANQLSIKMELDYKAIQHHLKVLLKNNMIIKIGDRYGAVYSISPLLESKLQIFDEIVTKLNMSNEVSIIR